MKKKHKSSERGDFHLHSPPPPPRLFAVQHLKTEIIWDLKRWVEQSVLWWAEQRMLTGGVLQALAAHAGFNQFQLLWWKRLRSATRTHKHTVWEHVHNPQLDTIWRCRTVTVSRLHCRMDKVALCRNYGMQPKPDYEWSPIELLKCAAGWSRCWWFVAFFPHQRSQPVEAERWRLTQSVCPFLCT